MLALRAGALALRARPRATAHHASSCALAIAIGRHQTKNQRSCATRANTRDLGRERASDLAKHYGEALVGDDPLVHMGRTNKTAMKRIALEKKSLARMLLSLPKSQISAMAVLPQDVKEAVMQGSGMASHIAIKRHEGLVAKRLRGLTDAEIAAVAGQVNEIESGTSGAIDPRVETLASSWRDRLLSANEEERGTTQSELFGALATREGWTFTRQELAQSVEAARKESIDRASSIAALDVAVDAELATMSPIDTASALAETRAFIANKLKASSAKPSVKASRKLLKLLRVIASYVVAASAV